MSVLRNGPNDPRPVKKDILVTKMVEAVAITSPITYSYSDVYKLLDVSTTPFFTEMRVISASVYGPAAGTVAANVIADGASYVDHGVEGSRRPALHIRFPEVVRIAWTSTTSTTGVLTTTGGAAVPNQFIVQFTIEVRGDASGDA